MNNLELNDYQIKTSRTGEPIPVVNNIHLHSVYNPIKEANGLAQNNIKIIKKNANLLILGLGFGYHLDSIIQELQKYHKVFRLVVIESNKKIFQDCHHYKPIKHSQVKIYVENNIENLYSNLDLVDFLSERPGVIAHPASFNLNDHFFRNFLTFKADQKISSIISNLQDKEIIGFCKSLDFNLTLNENLENYTREKNQITENIDHLIIAYKKLISIDNKNINGEK